MNQTTLSAAFDATPTTGIKLNDGKLFVFGGIFYEVRKGAVRFVKAKGQEKLSRRYTMSLAMVKGRAASDLAAAPRHAAVQNIRPMGRAGVADFLRYYAKQTAKAV